MQDAFLRSQELADVSLSGSTAAVQQMLDTNVTLARSVIGLESRLRQKRESAQSRLLGLRALERQWRAKQTEQDVALRNFSPPAFYQLLQAAVGEKETAVRSIEDAFLDDDGDGSVASERELADFLKRLREGVKTAYLRRERKMRWDEGRVGGWR